jgi:NhaA family Na+:H+ antiporter
MRHPLYHWINDGLMVIFFFVIGLEVKRELVLGELRDIQRAALPIAAAIGGMVAPALIYLLLQAGQPGQRGWGIPMATDIAFVVGCMAVLGDRVPHGFRVMILTLAIADDIGAILVIAIGYTESINGMALGLGTAGIALISLLARLGVRSFFVYTLLGALIWLAFHESGVHATIAGVILGLMTPARAYLSETAVGEALAYAREVVVGGDAVHHPANEIRRVQRAAREAVSPLVYLEATLHPWVAFVIMPVFALANAGVSVKLGDLSERLALAVVLGLFLGKPIGIFAASWAAVKLGLARLPTGVSWGVLLAGGVLAGIGFTMSLFIAGLALPDELLSVSKIGVLSGSLLSAVVGMGMLLVQLRGRQRAPAGQSE